MFNLHLENILANYIFLMIYDFTFCTKSIKKICEIRGIERLKTPKVCICNKLGEISSHHLCDLPTTLRPADAQLSWSFGMGSKWQDRSLSCNIKNLLCA